MVAKIRFWLSERSMSITKLGFVVGYDIKICVTVFFIKITRPCIITLNFETYCLGKERFESYNIYSFILGEEDVFTSGPEDCRLL